MSKLNNFVKEARARNVPDVTIRRSLISAGWLEADVDAALLGDLVIPKPNNSRQGQSTDAERPSLGSLDSALLHVLLWFFTAASTVAISAVASSLFGGSVSTEALAAMIAVVVITFTPYAVFFVRYLKKVKETPATIPGRVWSIITVCIHSIGTMIAGITLVSSLIVGGSSSVVFGAALIAVLNIVILINYSQASFVRPSKKRRQILSLHLIALAVLLGAIFTVSLIRLAPAQDDMQVRDKLIESSHEISEFTAHQNKLPSENEVSLPEGVTYSQTSDKTYELCATFNLDTTSRDNDSTHLINDNHTSTYDLQHHKSGEQCFEFQSGSLDYEDDELEGLSPASPGL